MSEGEGPHVSIVIEGLESLKIVAHRIPEVPLEAILPALKELGDLGVDVAKATLSMARSPLSSGETARRMTKDVEEVQHEAEWTLRIGPRTGNLPAGHQDYSKFVSMETGPLMVNRPVQLEPHAVRWGYVGTGTWRFIGLRPRIAAHPWMQNVKRTVQKGFTRLFGKEIFSITAEVDREQSRAKKEISLRGFVT